MGTKERKCRHDLEHPTWYSCFQRQTGTSPVCVTYTIYYFKHFIEQVTRQNVPKHLTDRNQSIAFTAELRCRVVRTGNAHKIRSRKVDRRDARWTDRLCIATMPSFLPVGITCISAAHAYPEATPASSGFAWSSTTLAEEVAVAVAAAIGAQGNRTRAKHERKDAWWHVVITLVVRRLLRFLRARKPYP